MRGCIPALAERRGETGWHPLGLGLLELVGWRIGSRHIRLVFR
jgi:hypothetical protein